METKKQSRKALFEKMQSARVTLSVALAESLKDYALKGQKPRSERENESEYVSDILLNIAGSPFEENIAKDLFFDMLRLLDREVTDIALLTSFEELTPFEYSKMTPAQFAAVVKTAQVKMLRNKYTDVETIKIYKSYYEIFNTPNEHNIF